MTQRIDRERLDAIRQKANENSTRHPRGWLAVYGADVTWLLDRLAALEHERDGLRVERNSIEAAARYLEREREHAGAALLSLQTAVRELEVEMRAEIQRIGRDYDIHTVPSVWAWTWTNKVAALLPDPAGTTAPKDLEDTAARVDGETQAATDRNYRVQRQGDK